jgi:hypothetical protein
MWDFRLWDDCDRVSALVRRMEHARSTNSAVFHEVRYNKLYVDEVQDYTQAERLCSFTCVVQGTCSLLAIQLSPWWKEPISGLKRFG